MMKTLEAPATSRPQVTPPQAAGRTAAAPVAKADLPAQAPLLKRPQRERQCIACMRLESLCRCEF